MEKTQKIKDKWIKVIENKERLTIDKITDVRIKLEK